MQPQRRGAAFITVTSLAKYLAYQDSGCGLAAWYPAHFTYAKPPFGRVQYLLDHGALVTELTSTLRDNGYQVSVEGDNGFVARGKVSGTKVAGTPDVVAVRPSDSRARVFEVKTGAPRPEHSVQTRLYLLFARCIPLLGAEHAAMGELSLEGVMIYRDGTSVPVPAPDDGFRAQVRAAIETLGADMPLPAKPSLAACTFCTVPGCAERFDAEAVTAATHDLFQ